MKIKYSSLAFFTLIVCISCNTNSNDITLKKETKKNQKQLLHNSMWNKEYSGTILVDEVSYYQAFYASQNYDTFYEIYAKFYLDRNDYVKCIKLKLLNYKGPLNIGFFENKEHKTDAIYTDKDSILQINLYVQGLSPKDSITIKLKKKVHKSAINYVNAFRTIMPLDFDNFDDDGPKVHKGVFDSEYFYRSHIGDAIKNELKPGQIDFVYDSAYYKEIKNRSSRCYTSTNRNAN